jgi:hypothetical protein
MVKLDLVLKNIVYSGNTDEATEVVKWEEIMNKVLQKMSTGNENSLSFALAPRSQLWCFRGSCRDL